MNIGSMSIIQNGIQGFMNGQALVNRSAAELAHINTSRNYSPAETSEDPITAKKKKKSVASLKEGEIYARAGAKVISAGYNTLGTLLDMKV